MSNLKPVLLALLIFVATLMKGETSPGTDALCSVGVYDGPGNAFVVVTLSADGLQYAFDSGIVGRIGAADAKVVCLDGAVRVFDNHIWPAIPLKITETVIHSHGTQLAGALLEHPESDGTQPLVVFAHGSEKSGWLYRARDPYQMVGRGISVLVYDKRGTGFSGGQYTQNVSLLADDLVAASTEARRLAQGRFDRFGLIGLSQGGWVAPLAANRAKADFVGVGYGLVVDIREEDAAQVALELREAGYGKDILALAREITDATARVATDPTPANLCSLDRVRIRFAGAPWLKHVRGDYTGILLNASREVIETEILPVFKSYDIDWSVDPVETVGKVTAPQLWVFAGLDRAAPADISIERLRALRDDGKEIEIRVFPETDHGMWEFSTALDGTRTGTRIAPGYHDLMADWALGRLHGRYGAADQR